MFLNNAIHSYAYCIQSSTRSMSLRIIFLWLIIDNYALTRSSWMNYAYCMYVWCEHVNFNTFISIHPPCLIWGAMLLNQEDHPSHRDHIYIPEVPSHLLHFLTTSIYSLLPPDRTRDVISALFLHFINAIRCNDTFSGDSSLHGYVTHPAPTHPIQVVYPSEWLSYKYGIVWIPSYPQLSGYTRRCVFYIIPIVYSFPVRMRRSSYVITCVCPLSVRISPLGFSWLADSVN